MKVSELMKFDASKYLQDENDYRLYLSQMFESGDPGEIQSALDDVAKARDMTALAREMGIAREALYRALARGDVLLPDQQVDRRLPARAHRVHWRSTGH